MDAAEGTCFHEFSRGNTKDCETGQFFWRADSVYIKEELMAEIHLRKLFSEVIEDYDYYGKTTVNREQWDEIQAVAIAEGGEWKKVINELKPWVKENFKSNEVFTIIGM